MPEPAGTLKRKAIGTLDTRVYDNGQPLARDGDIKVRKTPHEVEVVIPWQTVNRPQDWGRDWGRSSQPAVVKELAA
jgi:hypothetical protein